NGEIVINIQESGIAAPSTTVLNGQLAIRAAIVHHRTDAGDVDRLLAAVMEFGARRTACARDQASTVGQSMAGGRVRLSRGHRRAEAMPSFGRLCPRSRTRAVRKRGSLP